MRKTRHIPFRGIILLAAVLAAGLLPPTPVAAQQQPGKPKKAYRVSPYTAQQARSLKVKPLSLTPSAGDVSGDGLLSLADAAMIRNHLMEAQALTGDALARADADGDGKVTLADVVYVNSRLSLPVIANNTVPLDEITTLTVTGVTTETITLSRTGSGTIHVGDILSGSACGGFLRKVTSVTTETQGQTIIAQTQQAALAEAIESGSFSGVYVPVESAPAGGKSELRWVPATSETRPLAKVFTVDLSGAIVHEDANLTVRIVEGSISFTPEIEIEGSIRWFGLEYFRVFLSGRIEMTCVARTEVRNPVSLKLTNPNWTLPLFPPIPISPVPVAIFIGPVPIVLDLEGTIGPTLSVTVPAAMNVQERLQTSIRCGGGAEFLNGQWRPLSTAQASASGAIEEWGMDAFSAKLSYCAAVGLKFFKVGGSYIKFGPYAKLVGETILLPVPQLALSLYGGVDSALSLDVKLLDWLALSYEVADWTIYERLILRKKLSAPPSIAVTSPNGGEFWQRGTSHNITWRSSGNPGSNVKIELYKEGSQNSVISGSTPNSGSCSWVIPASQTAGSDYKIKIMSTSNPSCNDYSNGDFCINAGREGRQVSGPGPSRRALTEMVYDSRRQVCVLYGGMGETEALADTWEWNGVEWTDRTASLGDCPGPRWGYALYYDETRGKVVLFAGKNNSSTRFNDVWEYDGTDWTQRNDVEGDPVYGFPDPNFGMGFCYDTGRQVGVFYGGDRWNDDFLDREHWEYDGSVWKRRPDGPDARRYLSMAYHAFLGQMIRYGGYPESNRTYYYSGTAWSDSGQGLDRNYYSQTMVYDSFAREAVLFSGHTYVKKIWVNTGTGWTEVTSEFSALPSGRGDYAATYDATRLCLVLFGGQTASGLNGETWVLGSFTSTVPVPASFAINNGASSTTSRNVTLNNTCTGSPTQYMASESATFSGASWQTYATAPSFTLSLGNGTKTVYFKVKNAAGESVPASDTITLNEGGGPGTIEMVSVPAGTFTMGRRDDGDDGTWGWSDELPRHQVTLSAYQIGKYEVTNAQYCEVLNWALAQGYLKNSTEGAYTGGDVYASGQMLLAVVSDSRCQIQYTDGTFTWKSRTGSGGAIFSMENHPVFYVTWYGAVAFCNWLSEKEGLTPCYNLSTWALTVPYPQGYRLPTEAEWERAAAWDGSKHWIFGFISDTLTGKNRCNYYDGNPSYLNPLGLTSYPYSSPVGWFNGVNVSPNGSIQTQDSPSPVGAYDMCGNAWEWCHDWYSGSYYSGGAMTNPIGPASGSLRVLRSGDWATGRDCRSAHRATFGPEFWPGGFGFRLARTQ